MKLRRQVRGAMVYPSIVLTIAVGVTIVLMVFVTPTFEKMFRDFGGTLPGPTQVVVDMSHFIVDHGVTMVVSAAEAISTSI